MKIITKETYLCVGELPFPVDKTIYKIFGISITKIYFIILSSLSIIATCLVFIKVI